MTKLDRLVEAINETTDSVKIIMFGSRSSGSETGDSDVDIAVIKRSKPRLGEKAEIYLSLKRQGYDWNPDPDIHLFSVTEFNEKLAAGDLFTQEIAKGKTIYAN